ncbi:MAG: DNA gyrase modulator, partial [Pseudomonadota bacterium]
MSHDTAPHLPQLASLIATAKKAGADAADAILVKSTSLSAILRLDQTERVERLESADLGLRVFVGRRMAIVSSADQSQKALDAMVDRAVAMARAVPEDPYAGLAEPDDIVGQMPAIDLLDEEEPSAEVLIGRAR